MNRIYYTIFNLIALAGIIYLGVDTFYSITLKRANGIDTQEVAMQAIPDIEMKGEPRLSEYSVIDDRNIFSKINKTASEDFDPQVEDLEPTQLKIRLLGTATGDPANAAAVIEDTRKRTQELYHIGDSVQQATVKTILRGKVVLRVDGNDEILTMEAPTSSDATGRTPTVSAAGLSRSIPAALERTITVRHSDIEESLSNITDLLSQASIRSHYTDGEADGLAITGIKAGSIFRRLGLRNGDIVNGVNGNEISSPEDLISLYEDLKSASNVSLQIVRRGRQRSMNYNILD